MEIECTAWAPTREEAAAFLKSVGVAELDPETNELRPIAEVHIHPFRPTETLSVVDSEGNEVSGWHFNLRFYGSSAETLTKVPPKEGWPPEADLFDRTYILELVEGRTGKIPGWVASAEDPVPPGYAVEKVRCFDPALVAQRRNVWV